MTIAETATRAIDAARHTRSLLIDTRNALVEKRLSLDPDQDWEEHNDAMNQSNLANAQIKAISAIIHQLSTLQ